MLRRTPDFQTGMTMLAIVSCSQVFFGCGQAQEQAQKGTTRISPCELFTGEQKRLEPHLALAGSGCVKVDYNKPELPIKVELELWHNGTSKSGGGPGTSITQPSEVSISVKEVSDAKEKSKYQVITVVSTKSGTISTTQLVDVPELNRGPTLPKRFGNTIEIKDTKPVAVWALVTDKGSVGEGAMMKPLKRQQNEPSQHLSSSFQRARRNSAVPVLTLSRVLRHNKGRK